MIKEFNTSIAYVCPYCSSITVKDLTVFNLSSDDRNSYFCTEETACGAICITIRPKKSTYEIIVSCPICEDTHVYNIKKVRFWQKDKPIVLKCPETGLGVLFIGNHDAVRKLIYEQENSILQETASSDMGDDMTLLFSIVEEINNLAKKDLISCSCESHMISIGIDSESIVLSCRNCGNVTEIPVTETELTKLLKASAIVLE